jgi:hypothetical protein
MKHVQVIVHTHAHGYDLKVFPGADQFEVTDELIAEHFDFEEGQGEYLDRLEVEVQGDPRALEDDRGGAHLPLTYARAQVWLHKRMKFNGHLLPDQRPTTEQLEDLQQLAVLFGLYDAADALKSRLSQRTRTP